jgi:hypothetical protein
MAEVFDLSKRSLRLPAVKPRVRRPLSPRDAANLLTAVALMDEACDTFTLFARDTHHPALREMFTLFARTMECYAGVIRSKMKSEGEGSNPRRA